MNKTDFIEELSKRSGIQKKYAKELLQISMEIIVETIQRKEDFTLAGFGILYAKEQHDREARNPKTGEPVNIPARTTVKFRPGRSLLEKINNINDEMNL